MYTFFQSPIWKDIKTLVYGDQSFSITLFDQEYRGITKEKKIWPLSTSWFQVLGVELPSNNIDRVREEVAKVYHDYHTSWRNIFMQWWITNEIIRFYNVAHRSPSFAPGMQQTRQRIERWLQEETGLVPSFRENMPLANIIIDISKDDTALLKEMNSWCKDRVRKAIHHDITFRSADPSEYDHFYDEWSKIVNLKNFHNISRTTFHRLMAYLKANNCGDIFVAYKDNDMLGGSIAVYDDTSITYLYGFSNRNPQYRNIGVHHFLKFKMFTRGRERWLHYCDLFGWAPTGYDNHPLMSVSKFKESLGGTKIERYGNYDIILNPRLYGAFKTYHNIRK